MDASFNEKARIPPGFTSIDFQYPLFRHELQICYTKWKSFLHQVEVFPPWIYVGWFQTYWSMWFTDNNLKEVKIQKMKSLARIPAGVATLLEPFFNTFPHSVQGCSVKWKSGSLTKSSMNEIDLLLPIDWTLGPLLLLLSWEYKSQGRKTFHVMILYR